MGDGFDCNRAVSLVVTAYHMKAYVPATAMGLDTEDTRHGPRMGVTTASARASAYLYVCMYVCMYDVWCSR